MYETPRQRRIRWAAAALAVVVAHVSAVAYAMMERPDDEVIEEPEGAVSFELAPLPVAAASDAPDSPPGPPVEMNETQTPEVTETKPPDAEIPEVDPSPLAPEPEIALAKPVPEAKPVEEEKEIEPDKRPVEEPKPAKEVAVPQLTAPPPTPVAPVAPASAAKKQGTTARASRQHASWQKELVTHLGKHRRYPSEARSRRIQGDTQVRFTLNRHGHVVASSIVSSSGAKLLDEEALAVLQRAIPLPEPPDEVRGETFDLVIPIRFRIR